MELHQRKPNKHTTLEFNNGCSTSPKPHKLRQWSLACKTVYFIVSISQKVVTKKSIFSNNMVLEGNVNTLGGLAHKRWCLACTAVKFIVSVNRKVQHPRSPSYVSLDIIDDVDSDDDLTASIIDGDLQQALIRMMRDRDLQSLSSFGGPKHLAVTLGRATVGYQKVIFASNVVFSRLPLSNLKNKGFLGFALEAIKETTVILHLLLLLISICTGIVANNGLKEGWYDGTSGMFLAVFLAVSLSAFSNFMKTRQLEKLIVTSDNEYTGPHCQKQNNLSVSDVVVGIIVFLKIGDWIPADGLFLAGHSLKVVKNQSQESEHVEVEINETNNPFLFFGTRVTHGYGTMVVICSVGKNSSSPMAKMMRSSMSRHDQHMPLHAQVKKLTSCISITGLLVASLVFVGLLIGHFFNHPSKTKTKTTEVINAVVDIISVAIPEGLPIAITVIFTYSMKMLKASRHALVRQLAAFENIGSVTTICTHKIGILTLNQMEVSEFWRGKEAQDQKQPLAINVHGLLKQAIGLNSSSSSGCSPTEKAVLSWAVLDLGLEMDEVKRSFNILRVEAFNSEKNRSGVMARKKRDNNSIVQVHWQGAAEMILPMCSSYYDRNGIIITMDDEEKKHFKEVIGKMATKSLRCVAFAHKFQDHLEEDDESGLTLLGLVGLKDSCRPGVREAVESCKNAGVDVKMFTRDSLETSKAIGIECGILKPGDEEAVVEGIEFRNYSKRERLQKIKRIKIIARSLPSDKLLMVKCLKKKGHIVAVTTADNGGDDSASNINDVASLIVADVGFSMGDQVTEVAKECSDIIILDNNFGSIVSVLRSSRCLYNNIQKFIQFQLTVNAAALIINLVAAVSFGKVPLTAAQLLWVNLIMDVVGALALATEQPTKDDLMKKPPMPRSSSKQLITKVMWRNLVAQALYQMIVILTIQFKGSSILNLEDDDKAKGTIIFNCFVLFQVFNEFNSRKLERSNIFEGIVDNKLFLWIIGMTILLQVVLVEFFAKFADTKRLSWGQWSACVAFAAFTWPIGWLAKAIPF